MANCIVFHRANNLACLGTMKTRPPSAIISQRLIKRKEQYWPKGPMMAFPGESKRKPHTHTKLNEDCLIRSLGISRKQKIVN